MCKEHEQTIKILKHDKNMPNIKKIEKGDWIDLYVCGIDKIYDEHGKEVSTKQDYEDKFYIKKDYSVRFNLGFSIEVPIGYETIIAPRSSTFKNTGMILTNSLGIIDFSYSGQEDTVKAHFHCTRDTFIDKYDRLCQFRIQRSQAPVNIQFVESLAKDSRGGYGSTGK